MGVKIARIICIVLIVAVLGLYCYEVFVLGTPYTENLVRTVGIIAAAVLAFIRTGRGYSADRSLSFYAKAYERFVKNAFTDNASARRKLLQGYKAYNENKLRKAEKLASGLKASCLNNGDREAVHILAALAYSGMGFADNAIAEYESLIARGIVSAVIYNNLGQQYAAQGQRDKALDCYEDAVNCDSNYAVGYNNMAQLYFSEGELAAAEDIALKALKADSRCYQASTLLAIIYALNDDKAASERYAHMAISSGQSASDLKNAIAYYKSVYSEDEED